MTVIPETVAPLIKQARISLVQFADAPLDKTTGALEEAGELLAEMFNALEHLADVVGPLEVDSDEVVLAAQVLADTGKRWRASAQTHGLVTGDESCAIVMPGPQIMNGQNAAYHMHTILGATGNGTPAKEGT